MPMGIKLLLALVLCLLLTFLATVAALGELFLPAFERADRQAADRELRHLKASFSLEQEKLRAYASDWAGWEVTSRFLLSDGLDLEQADLIYAGLADQEIDFFVLYDASESLRWAAVSDRHVPGVVDLSAALSQAIKGGLPVKSRALPGAASGLVVSEMGPLMLVALPVVARGSGADPLGKLLVGRLLDSDFQVALGNRTDFDFSLLPDLSQAEGLSASTVPQMLRLEQGIEVRSALASDFAPEVSYAVALRMPAPAFDEGRGAMAKMVLFHAVAALLLLVIIFLLFQFLVMRPLSRFAHRLVLAGEREGGASDFMTGQRGLLGVIEREIDTLLRQRSLSGAGRGSRKSRTAPLPGAEADTDSAK